MPTARPVPSRKRLIFIVTLSSMLLSTAALSAYKIGVANAYMRIEIPTDPGAPREGAQPPPPSAQTLARGAHVAAVVGCADCHGADYGGRVLLDRPGYAVVSAPNLTRGAGGRGRTLDAAGWRQAVRLGLDGERRTLWAMPRAALLALADEDVDAVVQHVRAMPPVDRELPHSRLGLRGYLAAAVRQLVLIDRTAIPERAREMPSAVGIGSVAVSLGPQPERIATFRAHAPAPADAEFGPYLATIGHCTSCHGVRTPMVGHQKAPGLRTMGPPNPAHPWPGGGRCPDGRTSQERGGPSRLEVLTASEAAAAMAAQVSP